MQKGEINILIVDDDPTLGKALKEAVSRAGFKAMHVTKPDEAISATKLQPIHAAVIDCMLPKMNGKDLAKRIKTETSATFPVVLVSGIYKDKTFAREAVQETGAVAFLTKPFDIQNLIQTLERSLESIIEMPLAPLQEALTKQDLTHKERIKMVNDTDECHGFDLPWIMSLLMHPRINGYLNIILPDGGVCGVGFQRGSIVQVNQQDATSYLGVLMVEYGFVTQAEIEEVMKTAGKTKKMGERLVEANVLSPHAIQIVMADQQGIRLSKTISESSVKVNFTESEEMRQDASMDRSGFTELVNDWLMSKIRTEWLKPHYMPWMGYSIKLGPEYSPNHRCFTIPVVQRVPTLMESLTSSPTLEQALAKIDLPDELVYPALHALVLSRVIRFGEPHNSFDYDAQRSRLQKLNADLNKQNYFERLGLSSRSKDSDIKRVYHELAKLVHPDKLSSETPADIQELNRQVFTKISEAYETLSDLDKKAAYLLELEKGRAEAIIEAEQLTDQARSLLTKGDFSKARDILQKAITLAAPSAETRLLLMWAKLKAQGAEKNVRLAEMISAEIAALPPEDRHNPTFYFVKGLHLRISGDLAGAKKNLEHAASLAPDFIDARRELSVLKAKGGGEADKPVDLLRGDLKDVVGLLFKKKK